jgi:hypothetical protein
MTYIALGVLVFVILFVSFRFGIPAGWPQHNVGTPIEPVDDHKTGGFETDFSRYEHQSPTRDSGPGWDS